MDQTRGKAFMDQIRRRALQTGLALLQVQNTPILALKGTTRTNTIRTTVLGITRTRTDLGTNPQPVSQEKSLYAISVISQATMSLIALTTESHLQKPKFNLFNRNTTHC